MAELIGVAASIIQIAGAGAKLSTTLYNFVGSATRADQEIADIAGDVELTANALDSVGKVFEDDDAKTVVSKKAVQDANNLIKRCEVVFDEIREVIEKRRKVCKDGKTKITALGKLSWPMKEQRVELLRRRLESLKNSLMLLLHVLHLANGQAKGKLEKSALELEREKIRQLHQAHQDSLQSLQALETKLSKVTLDDEETLRGSSAPSRVPTLDLAFMAQSTMPPKVKRTQGEKAHDSARSQMWTFTDDSDAIDSDGTVTDGEGEHISIDELNQCAKHVEKLLRRITSLQETVKATQKSRHHSKSRVHKLYRRFCQNFETEIKVVGKVQDQSLPLPQFEPPSRAQSANERGSNKRPSVKTTSASEYVNNHDSGSSSQGTLKGDAQEDTRPKHSVGMIDENVKHLDPLFIEDIAFTADDDMILVNLVEIKRLNWEQIADFFPGKSPARVRWRYMEIQQAKHRTYGVQPIEPFPHSRAGGFPATVLDKGSSPTILKPHEEQMIELGRPTKHKMRSKDQVSMKKRTQFGTGDPPIPTSPTPSTPVHPKSFSHQPPQSFASTDLGDAHFGFSDDMDSLENFDFDSFLHVADDHNYPDFSFGDPALPHTFGPETFEDPPIQQLQEPQEQTQQKGPHNALQQYTRQLELLEASPKQGDPAFGTMKRHQPENSQPLVQNEADKKALADYQMSLMTLTCGNPDRPGRLKMFNTADFKADEDGSIIHPELGRIESPRSFRVHSSDIEDLKRRIPNLVVTLDKGSDDRSKSSDSVTVTLIPPTPYNEENNFQTPPLLQPEPLPSTSKPSILSPIEGGSFTFAMGLRGSGFRSAALEEHHTPSLGPQGTSQSNMKDDKPLFVNPKQFHRIIKRRVTRQKPDDALGDVTQRTPASSDDEGTDYDHTEAAESVNFTQEDDRKIIENVTPVESDKPKAPRTAEVADEIRKPPSSLEDMTMDRIGRAVRPEKPFPKAKNFSRQDVDAKGDVIASGGAQKRARRDDDIGTRKKPDQTTHDDATYKEDESPKQATSSSIDHVLDGHALPFNGKLQFPIASESKPVALDYQKQLMLLEHQNKKRLLMARREQQLMADNADVPQQKDAQSIPPTEAISAPAQFERAALHWQMQLALLDQQNKARLLMAQQEQQSIGNASGVQQEAVAPSIPPTEEISDPAQSERAALPWQMQLALLDQQNKARLLMAQQEQQSIGNASGVQQEAVAPSIPPTETVPYGAGSNHALADYQMQLLLLEAQKKKRLLIARQEQELTGNASNDQRITDTIRAPIVENSQPSTTQIERPESRTDPKPRVSVDAHGTLPSLTASNAEEQNLWQHDKQRAGYELNKLSDPEGNRKKAAARHEEFRANMKRKNVKGLALVSKKSEANQSQLVSNLGIEAPREGPSVPLPGMKGFRQRVQKAREDTSKIIPSSEPNTSVDASSTNAERSTPIGGLLSASHTVSSEGSVDQGATSVEVVSENALSNRPAPSTAFDSSNITPEMPPQFFYGEFQAPSKSMLRSPIQATTYGINNSELSGAHQAPGTQLSPLPYPEIRTIQSPYFPTIERPPEPTQSAFSYREHPGMKAGSQSPYLDLSPFEEEPSSWPGRATGVESERKANAEAPPDTRFTETTSPKTLMKPPDQQSSRKLRKRTKAGCLTCRKRRTRCGEERPTCENCIKSKRQCEGYNQRVVFKPPIGDWPNQFGGAGTYSFHYSTCSGPPPTATGADSVGIDFGRRPDDARTQPERDVEMFDKEPPRQQVQLPTTSSGTSPLPAQNAPAEHEHGPSETFESDKASPALPPLHPDSSLRFDRLQRLPAPIDMTLAPDAIEETEHPIPPIRPSNPAGQELDFPIITMEHPEINMDISATTQPAESGSTQSDNSKELVGKDTRTHIQEMQREQPTNSFVDVSQLPTSTSPSISQPPLTAQSASNSSADTALSGEDIDKPAHGYERFKQQTGLPRSSAIPHFPESPQPELQPQLPPLYPPTRRFHAFRDSHDTEDERGEVRPSSPSIPVPSSNASISPYQSAFDLDPSEAIVATSSYSMAPSRRAESSAHAGSKRSADPAATANISWKRAKRNDDENSENGANGKDDKHDSEPNVSGEPSLTSTLPIKRWISKFRRTSFVPDAASHDADLDEVIDFLKVAPTSKRVEMIPDVDPTTQISEKDAAIQEDVQTEEARQARYEISNYRDRSREDMDRKLAFEQEKERLRRELRVAREGKRSVVEMNANMSVVARGTKRGREVQENGEEERDIVDLLLEQWTVPVGAS